MHLESTPLITELFVQGKRKIDRVLFYKYLNIATNWTEAAQGRIFPISALNYTELNI
jgi:hypothetical protein